MKDRSLTGTCARECAMKSQIIAFLLVPLIVPFGLLQTAVPQAETERPAWQRQIDFQPKARSEEDESLITAITKGVRVGSTRVKVELNTSKFALGMSLSL